MTKRKSLLGRGAALISVIMAFTFVVEASAAPIEESFAYYDTYIKAQDLGKYDFEVETHEIPSHEVLPIIDKSYFPVTVTHFQSEVDNTEPSATYTKNTITKVDVVFAIGKYNKTADLKAYTANFKSQLNLASNFIDATVTELESTFSSEFALHTTWETSSDMDTHIKMYDASGRQLEHIWYGHRQGDALTLDKDDTKGANSAYEDYTETAGIYNEGEWFTIDFPNLPASATRMVISIVAYRGTSPTTITLVDKMSKKVVTKSKVNLTSKKQEITIGELFLDNGAWSFKKANGEIFGGTTAVPLGETLKDVSWRDGAVRFIVNITDDVPEELLDTGSKDYQYTVAKLLDSNAYLINVGNNTNKEYLDRLLKAITHANSEQGTFIQSRDVPTTFTEVANWIINKVKTTKEFSDWILVNTEILWETEYNDQEHDLPLNFGEHDGTKSLDNSDVKLANLWGVGLTHLYNSEKIFAEKWRYRHFNNYFDNSPIRESFHNVWIEDPVEIFPNPGLYRINYKRRDNPLHPNTNLSDAFDEYRYWSRNYDRIDSTNSNSSNYNLEGGVS